MSVMLVGADHLGHIEKNLESLGIGSIEHLTGRNTAERKSINIPSSTKLIVIFIDYVNHTTAVNIKKTAKSQGVPLIFSKRSWSSLCDKLEYLDLKTSAGCF